MCYTLLSSTVMHIISNIRISIRLQQDQKELMLLLSSSDERSKHNINGSEEIQNDSAINKDKVDLILAMCFLAKSGTMINSDCRFLAGFFPVERNRPTVPDYHSQFGDTEFKKNKLNCRLNNYVYINVNFTYVTKKSHVPYSSCKWRVSWPSIFSHSTVLLHCRLVQ